MKDYSAKIVNEIKKILDEDDWDYSFENEFGIIITKLDCKEEIKRIGYMINVGDDWYRVSAKASLKADKRDKDAMLALAELTCRANCWLVGGFMGLDMDTGTISVSCVVNCKGIAPSKGMIKHSIYYPAAVFGVYGRGLRDVIFGRASAKEAADRCEKRDEGGKETGKTVKQDSKATDRMFHRLSELFESPEESKGSPKDMQTKTRTEINFNLFESEGDNE